MLRRLFILVLALSTLASAAPAWAGPQTFWTVSTGVLPKATPTPNALNLSLYPVYYQPCYRGTRARNRHALCCQNYPLRPGEIQQQCYSPRIHRLRPLNLTPLQRPPAPPMARVLIPPALRKAPPSR